MDKRRLMELAGVSADSIDEMCGYGHEQQEAAPMVIASVRDAGDGNFIGLVGPFRSEEQARRFFSQLPDADELSIEIEAPTRPEQFAEEMGQ